MVTVESPAQHRLQSASVSLRPNIAYVATQSVNGGPPTTIYFDHGKYALFNLDTFYLYDGTDTFLRWDGNRKAHTAQLDTPLALNRLYKMIQHEGVHITSQKSGIAPSLLQHFARLWIPGLQPRVLSYPLQVFAQGQRDFPLCEYTRSGTEKVAGFLCDVLVSRNASHDKVWVEPATHCILRQHITYPSGNPRVPPTTRDWNVSQFRPVPSVDAKWFRIPPGYTVLLPGILQDLPLPAGVQRKIQTGKNAFVGADIAPTVDAGERYIKYQEAQRRFQHRVPKERAR